MTQPPSTIVHPLKVDSIFNGTLELERGTVDRQTFDKSHRMMRIRELVKIESRES